MNVDENGSVGKSSVQNMVFFLSKKAKITIRRAEQSSKSTTLTSHITWQVLALLSLHLHMIWIIEHRCVEVKACGANIRLELYYHHSRWDIILQADAAQMGKCCNPLQSGMSTSRVFHWILPDFIRYSNMKYLRWGTIYLNEIHQTSKII